MKIMSIDAEYNQPSTKTIQIGAGIYDAQSGQLIEKFEVYVNPYEPISRGTPGVDPRLPEGVDIVALTGITDADVSGGMSIQEAYSELKRFHEKHKPFKNPLVWGSGVRNDSHHIYLESGTKEDNFMGFRVLDVKSIYQSLRIHRNEEIKGGLEKACNVAGIGFEGTKHTAFADAHNTFRLWFHLMKKFDNIGTKRIK
jgi:inhibitor of KinA sporulation pathway (predicted exonuclease)